jgi:hypothetical protein
VKHLGDIPGRIQDVYQKRQIRRSNHNR